MKVGDSVEVMGLGRFVITRADGPDIQAMRPPKASKSLYEIIGEQHAFDGKRILQKNRDCSQEQSESRNEYQEI